MRCFNIFAAALTILVVSNIQSNAITVPRPDDLIYFSLLDDETGAEDVTGNRKIEYNNGAVGLINGPFADPKTCFQSIDSNTALIVYNYVKPSHSSFTFSVFMYTGNTGSYYYSGIFAEQDSSSSYYPKRMSLLRYFNDLYIYSYNILTNSNSPVSSVGVKNFFKNYQWHHIVITYDDKDKTLVLYDTTGTEVYQVKINCEPYYEDTKILLGYGYNSNGGRYGFSTVDAMACPMIYGAVLKTNEIAELSEACRLKGSINPPPFSTEPWPEPGNLKGIWPLSAAYKLGDVGSNNLRAKNTFQANSIVVGPFGGVESAIEANTTELLNSGILHVQSELLATKQKPYTIAFFFKPENIDSNETAGLFEFVDSLATTDKTLQITYQGGNVTIWSRNVAVGKYGPFAFFLELFFHFL